MNLLPGQNMLPAMEENSFLPSSDTTLGKALEAQSLVDKPQVNDQIKSIIDQVAPLPGGPADDGSSVTRVLNDVQFSTVEGKSNNQIAGLLTEAQDHHRPGAERGEHLGGQRRQRPDEGPAKRDRTRRLAHVADPRPQRSHPKTVRPPREA